MGTTMPAALSTAVTFVVTQLGETMDIITGHPILLLGVAAWAVGLGIGLFKRLV